MRQHQLYETGDTDAPDILKDRNGAVVLRMCRACGRAEASLDEPCSSRATPVRVGIPTDNATWQARYLDLARHVAGWSKDPSTKVGTVIVGRDRRELCVGYNGFPPGIADTDERLRDKLTKYALTQHAERNALDNARFDLRGGLLATTMHPCSECSKSIISRGIAVVICPLPLDREPWRSDAVTAVGMLEEGGVRILYDVAPREDQ